MITDLQLLPASSFSLKHLKETAFYSTYTELSSSCVLQYVHRTNCVHLACYSTYTELSSSCVLQYVHGTVFILRVTVCAQN